MEAPTIATLTHLLTRCQRLIPGSLEPHIRALRPTLTSHSSLAVSLVALSRTWRFRSLRTFFGLSPDYMESVYETFFILKYHGGWSFIEAYNLPVKLRRWFTKRLEKQFKQEKSQMEKSKGKHRIPSKPSTPSTPRR